MNESLIFVGILKLMHCNHFLPWHKNYIQNRPGRKITVQRYYRRSSIICARAAAPPVSSQVKHTSSSFLLLMVLYGTRPRRAGLPKERSKNVLRIKQYPENNRPGGIMLCAIFEINFISIIHRCSYWLGINYSLLHYLLLFNVLGAHNVHAKM